MGNIDDSKPLTEAAALSDILNWSLDRPGWFGDALRRLVTQDELAEEDYDALLRICIDPDAGFDPLSPDHVSAERLPDNPVSLLGIHEVRGVNALASQQELKFAPRGLNIVYGDNGSGKSGYVRILKHACRSRDNHNLILNDVNETVAEQQSAQLHYLCGQSEETFDWSPDGDEHGDLPAISIFDSRSANMHLQEESDVAYIPYPMLLLQRLVSVADVLRERLSNEVDALRAQTPDALSNPDVDSDTEAGAFLCGLKASSKPAKLASLIALTDEDEKRITALQFDLQQDAEKAIASLRRKRARLLECVDEIEFLLRCASEDEVKALNNARADKDRKVEAAKMASEKLFAASPLPDIGGDTWKALWEAARSYSDAHAYPEQSFPSTSSDDLCVLCQQPLLQEAQDRWSTFEDFIKGTTKTDEINSRALHREKVQAATSAFPNFELWFARLRNLREDFENPRLNQAVRQSLMSAARRLRDMQSDKAPSTCLNELPQDLINPIIADIDGRIRSLSADEDSTEKKALRLELRKLLDRRLLRTLEADILSEIVRLQKIAVLEKAKKTTNAKPITDKNKEISDLLVTSALRQRFIREVEKLKIGTMPIELVKERDRKGKSFFRIKLVGMPKQPVGEVLSEGEHRCVALAAFLSEIVTAREYSGIVFDDPMSSLDHVYREHVAARLVEEAEHRQVVVFTHDLSFLFVLTEEAERKDRALHFQTVMRKSRRPGFVEDDLPMKAKKAKAMAATIKTELNAVKDQFDNLSMHERERTAQGFITQLRQTWEQGVADYIQPVLKRFHSKVSPSSLFKLLVLTPEDVKAVSAAYSRLSNDVHATVETLNPETVEHEDLVREIRILDAWLIDLSKRQQSIAVPD